MYLIGSFLLGPNEMHSSGRRESKLHKLSRILSEGFLRKNSSGNSPSPSNSSDKKLSTENLVSLVFYTHIYVCSH